MKHVLTAGACKRHWSVGIALRTPIMCHIRMHTLAHRRYLTRYHNTLGASSAVFPNQARELQPRAYWQCTGWEKKIIQKIPKKKRQQPPRRRIYNNDVTYITTRSFYNGCRQTRPWPGGGDRNNNNNYYTIHTRETWMISSAYTPRRRYIYCFLYRFCLHVI